MSNIPFDRQIWTGQECADYLGQSYSQFMKETSRRVDFPNDLVNVRHRWLASDVVAWKQSAPKDPPPPKTCLYRHYDSAGSLLYVGISLHSLHRTGRHSLNSRWFELVATIKVEHFSTRKEALAAERVAIQSEKPLWNVHHRGR